jgi:hypothetical protein
MSTQSPSEPRTYVEPKTRFETKVTPPSEGGHLPGPDLRSRGDAPVGQGRARAGGEPRGGSRNVGWIVMLSLAAIVIVVALVAF